MGLFFKQTEKENNTIVVLIIWQLEHQIQSDDYIENKTDV